MPAVSNRTLAGFLVGSIAGAGAFVGAGTLSTPTKLAPRNVTPEQLSDAYDSLVDNVDPETKPGLTVKGNDDNVKIVTRMYEGLCLAAPPIGFSGKVGPECKLDVQDGMEETVPAT